MPVLGQTGVVYNKLPGAGWTKGGTVTGNNGGTSSQIFISILNIPTKV